MSQIFYLSAEQLERIKPFFPLSHGIPRVDDMKVINTGKEPVDAMIAVVDEAGGAAVMAITVSARGMYVNLVDNLARETAGVDRVGPTDPDPNKHCFVIVEPYTGSKKLTGFAMTGNGMESMGYTVR